MEWRAKLCVLTWLWPDVTRWLTQLIRWLILFLTFMWKRENSTEFSYVIIIIFTRIFLEQEKASFSGSTLHIQMMSSINILLYAAISTTFTISVRRWYMPYLFHCSLYICLFRLLEPDGTSEIASYRITRILFCCRGREGTDISDCFAFTCSQGSRDSQIFQCHIFRCEVQEAVSWDLFRHVDARVS